MPPATACGPSTGWIALALPWLVRGGFPLADDQGGPVEQEWLAGNVGGAWRHGAAVHRPVGPWTPAVHALLRYLDGRIEHVPQVLGTDERGREVLTYLPGRVVDNDTEQLTPAQLRAVVAWTRRFHDVVAGFDHPGPWRYADMPGPATLIGHNDIAPYNVCFDGNELAGVFDWDLAGPSTPLMELAFVAWNCVPLWRDAGEDESAERLRIIAETYAGPSAREILEAVPARIGAMLDWIPAAAAAGDQGMVNLVAQGEPGRSREALAELVGRIAGIATRLRPAG